MLTGISYWSMPQGLDGTCPVPKALELAKSNGFDALELAISPSGVVNVDLTESQCRLMRREIDATGVIVETLASGMSWAFNPVSDEESVRKKAVELHEKALHRAAWLGCDSLLFVPGVVTSPIAPGERVRYDLAYQRAIRAVEQLLKTAERVGVDLCIENVWNGFLYSPLEFQNFIDHFASDRVGVYFDVGNVLGYQQYPPDWISLLGTRIKRVHVKGFREEFGFVGNYEFCGLHEGDVPLIEALNALCEIGYDRTIVAEMLPYKPGLLEQTSHTLNSLLRPSLT